MMSKNPITAIGVTTPTVSAVAQYAAGDAVGGLLTGTLSLDAVANGGGGLTASIVVIDLDKQDCPFVFFLFDQAITPTNDNSPLAISNADLLHCIGWIEVVAADYKSAGTFGDIACVSKVIPVRPLGSQAIYAQAKYSGTGTPKWSATTGRLTFKLGIVED